MPASLEDNRFSNYFVGLTFLIAWFGGGTLASDDEYRLLQVRQATIQANKSFELSWVLAGNF